MTDPSRLVAYNVQYMYEPSTCKVNDLHVYMYTVARHKSSKIIMCEKK